MSEVGETIKLPPLREAYLDEQDLESYCEDIEALAVVFDLQLKRLPEHYVEVDQRELSLEVAMSALKAKAVLGVQLRYLWEGRTWWDTLMWTQRGLRLIRICPEDIEQTLEHEG